MNNNRFYRESFNWLCKHKLFFLIVFLPVIITAFYFLFMVSEQYESTAQIIIKENTSSSEKIKWGPLNFNEPKNSNVYILKNYILSLDLAHAIDKKILIKKYFQSRKIDFLSRLSSTADEEKFLAYYRSKITIDFDSQANIMNISVKAFDPKTAKRFLEEILLEITFFDKKMIRNSAVQKYQLAEKEFDVIKQKYNKYIEMKKGHKLVNNEAGKLNSDFADAMYKTALFDLANAKLNLSTNEDEIFISQSPILPDNYSYPRKIYDIVSLFIALNIFYFLGNMIIIIIREHID